MKRKALYQHRENMEVSRKGDSLLLCCLLLLTFFNLIPLPLQAEAEGYVDLPTDKHNENRSASAKTSEAATRPDAQLKFYRIDSGDRIRVTVDDEPDLKTEQTITNQGKILMPLLGEVDVQGLTTGEVSDKLKKLLMDGYLRQPVVTVTIAKYPDFHVHGEVRKSGRFPYQPGLTVRRAISQASGFGVFADVKRLSITRRSGNGWESIAQANLEDPVMPKDIIHVPMATNQQENNESQEMAHRIGLGDKVKITVENEPNLGIDTRVSPQGSVNLPLIGEVRLLNLTAKEAEESIRQRLADGFLVNPNVSVAIAEYRVYYLYGEVKKAGGYPFQPGLTVRKAIALAEGFTDFADKKDIRVVHDDDPTFKEHKIDMNDPVFPGDVIQVTASFW
ncbi:polysaccharide biosynthesis/export family protein [Candidatus Magnetaquicoccus inordinatus]|uniref:polysaccharide biosynthesis/export family protein n=1 Tax=Candidatus Magnetaquicoccus inordinatus TaxID=2496818 RepID=UPI00187D43F9|nr:polysaccharide biosynthesis/export family protein [Candidatus Magnetaquicoccus inordinatus]